MTGIDSYSTTASTNATATGGSVNWAEGQTAQSVNNSARQNMADLRSAFNDLIWFNFGTGDQGSGNIAVPSVYASSTSFTIAGVDVTSVYHAGRAVRAVGTLTGTIYGVISSSSFSTNTTVNVTWDSGSLSNETLVISLSQIPVTGKPVPFTGIDLSGSNSGSPTFTGTVTISGQGIVKGTATNDSASAGYIGEYKEDTIAAAGALSLTSETPRNIVAVSLTAGDWDVEGNGCFTGAASTTISYAIASISSTSATLPTDSSGGYAQQWYNNVAFFSTSGLSLPTGAVRLSLASTTTIYLVIQAKFATDTCSGYGHIRARRVR